MRKRHHIPAWLRLYVLHRDGHKCIYCDRPAEGLDHVVPIALSGPTEPYNLVACCRSCNYEKNDSVREVWLRWAFEYLVDVGEDLTPIVQGWEDSRVGELAREA